LCVAEVIHWAWGSAVNQQNADDAHRAPVFSATQKREPRPRQKNNRAGDDAGEGQLVLHVPGEVAEQRRANIEHKKMEGRGLAGRNAAGMRNAEEIRLESASLWKG
jgi:hypothetical protein